MHWLLIGYMLLFIHRPFEVWPALGDLRVERVYMLVTLAAWVVHPGKRWLPNAQHAAYALFACAVLAAWLVSPWSEQGQPAVEDYFKVLVFYLLLVTCVADERGLRRMAVGFVAVTAVYLAHSFREYLNGRHTYRMGIERLIGVDSSLGDPNSFGASVVYFLPFVVALWKADVGGKQGRYALAGVAGLAVLCLLLTGSRSSLLGLGVLGAVLVWRSRHRGAWLTAGVLAAPVAFVLLPGELQTRFETIVNPDAGPANAKLSGEGRLNGFVTGFELWANNPLTGVGPGAWRPASGSVIESHNLYGQLVGETGALGLIGFAATLWCFRANAKAVQAIRRRFPEWEHDLVFQIASAVGTSVFLLLFMGNFGHNLFRFSWLWYGGFLIIARHCAEARVREWEAATGDEEEWPDEDEWPEGWTAHAGHAEVS